MQPGMQSGVFDFILRLSSKAAVSAAILAVVGVAALPNAALAATDVALLPRNLSPWNMFVNADIVVQVVMVGLAFASLVTWTVWLAKTIEVRRKTATARRRLRLLETDTVLAKAEKENGDVQRELAANVRNDRFVAGFGSNGGEEFLSFLNISEALLVKGGKDWEEWDAKMTKGLEKAQNGDGSWSGQHCITGKTFCTATALLVLMADRAPVPTAGSSPAPKVSDIKK